MRLSDTLPFIKADLEAGLLTLDEALEKAFDAWEELIEEGALDVEAAYNEGYHEGERDNQDAVDEAHSAGYAIGYNEGYEDGQLDTQREYED